MTWSADSVIDTIFVPLYAVLLIANIFNCAKHGRAREAGYILLVVACISTPLRETGLTTS